MQPWPEPETAPLTAEDRAIIVRQGTPPSVVSQRIRDDALHTEWLGVRMRAARSPQSDPLVARGIANNIHDVLDYSDPDAPEEVY